MTARLAAARCEHHPGGDALDAEQRGGAWVVVRVARPEPHTSGVLARRCVEQWCERPAGTALRRPTSRPPYRRRRSGRRSSRHRWSRPPTCRRRQPAGGRAPPRGVGGTWPRNQARRGGHSLSEPLPIPEPLTHWAWPAWRGAVALVLPGAVGEGGVDEGVEQ